jgi:hypothetical protein
MYFLEGKSSVIDVFITQWPISMSRHNTTFEMRTEMSVCITSLIHLLQCSTQLHDGSFAKWCPTSYPASSGRAGCFVQRELVILRCNHTIKRKYLCDIVACKQTVSQGLDNCTAITPTATYMNWKVYVHVLSIFCTSTFNTLNTYERTCQYY